MYRLTQNLAQRYVYIAARPLWLAAVLLIGAVVSYTVHAQGEGAQSSARDATGQVRGTANFTFPDWFKQSFLEIAEDAAEAGAAGRHVLLFFHLSDCPYCERMLRENFHGGANSAFIQAHFDCIDINVRGSREILFDAHTQVSEKALARQLQVLYTPGILWIDENNRAVLRLDGYRSPQQFRRALEYVQQRAYQRESLLEFTQRTQHTTQQPYSFHPHPALQSLDDLQQVAQQPLAIIFEDADCEDCAEIHTQLFARKDVSEALSELRVVRLDAHSDAPLIDPWGKRTSPRAWAAELGLHYRPGILLLDRGRELARIENRLYSWHFMGFVRWVAGRHYQEYPDVYQYMAKLRAERLARGEDVSYID